MYYVLLLAKLMNCETYENGLLKVIRILVILEIMFEGLEKYY